MIFSFFETVWTVITVTFWACLGIIALILLSGLQKALSRGSSTAQVPSAFSPVSAKSIAVARKWWDLDDPDAPFKWAREAGYPRGVSHPGQSPLSFGGGRPYNGEDGPLGFTTGDTALVGAYLDAGYRISSESHAWVIEATDGLEWELDQKTPGKWVCYQREW